MHIQLKRPDLETAIREYLARRGVTQPINEIVFTKGRKNNNLVADIDMSGDSVVPVEADPELSAPAEVEAAAAAEVSEERSETQAELELADADTDTDTEESSDDCPLPDEEAQETQGASAESEDTSPAPAPVNPFAPKAANGAAPKPDTPAQGAPSLFG